MFKYLRASHVFFCVFESVRVTGWVWFAIVLLLGRWWAKIDMVEGFMNKPVD